MDVSIRPWTFSDLPNLVRYANNSKIARYLTDQFPHPYSKEDGLAFIHMATEGDPTRIFAIEVDGHAVGGIGLHPQTDIFRKNAELGYWVAEPYWGKGIATQAIQAIVAYGFATFDIHRIFARPFGNNLASQRVLQKNGFVLEAKFEQTLLKNGEYLDELVYAIRNQLPPTI